MMIAHVRQILTVALAGVLLAPAAPASAANTTRVKDINPAGDSYPYGFTAMKVGENRLLFFQADDGTSGYELWRTDGTAAGTKRVKDINLSGDSLPEELTVMSVGTKRFLFFRAEDGTSGTELWRTDGTAAGTKRVKDINPGPDGSGPSDLRVMKVGTKRLLFFQATDGSSGSELWRTDGTSAGTKRVKDINPGSSSDPSELTVMNVGGRQLLFFRAGDGWGTQLWRSDGTAAGTKRVKEINPGADSHPSYLTPMKIGTKHILFFRAYDSVHGAELWRSDGTAAGTKLVSDIVPGGGFSAPSDLRVMKIGTKRMLFFRADDGTSGEELWRSDGTAAGTKRVKDINPGTANSFPGDFTVMKVGTKRVLFFAASDGTSGRELWRSDGSGAGTRRVKDITAGGDGSTPSELVVMKVGTRQLLYLRASDAGGGSELWRSDGTKSGTRLAADIVPGAGGSDPYGFTVMKVGRRPVLFFGATDGSSGYELWRYRP